jgi:hypothetical protein
MIDGYGRLKALYYRLRHAYAPIALSGLADEKGSVELWVVNDRPEAKRGTIEWTLMRTDGHEVTKGRSPVAIETGPCSLRAIRLDLSDQIAKAGAENLTLWATLRMPGEPDSRTSLLFGRPKDASLQNPGIVTTVVSMSGGFSVTLKSARPALRAWIDLKGLDAEFSDNFVDVEPDHPITLRVSLAKPTSIAEFRRALRVRSLYDTYLPSSEPNPVVRPGEDGSLTLTADEAEIVGDGAILELGEPSNIGNWTRVHDGLRWTVRGAVSGNYLVSALVSIPDSEAGSTFEVSVQGQHVNGRVPGTGSWTSYRSVPLGEVKIEGGGIIHIELTPLSLVQGHVMNLRTLTLTRVSR